MNPVKAARKQAGLTLEDASGQAGVHLQAFFLQEQGVYPTILPAIAEWMRSRDAYLPTAQKEYREFQHERRVAAGETHGFRILELGPPEGNPTVSLRGQLQVSRMGLCKLLCVHPGLLYRVEHGISRSIPQQLLEALQEAGIPVAVLEELKYRHEEMYG